MLLKVVVSVEDQVLWLDGLGPEQEELHGNIAQCKEFLLGTGAAGLLKMAVECGRLAGPGRHAAGRVLDGRP